MAFNAPKHPETIKWLIIGVLIILAGLGIIWGVQTGNLTL